MNIGTAKIGMGSVIKFDLLKAVLDAEGKQVYDAEGVPMAYEKTRREVVPWFHNQVLDNARNQMADFDQWCGTGSYAQVGESSTLPLSSHTGLITWTAGTAVISGTPSAGAQGSAPYYRFDQRTYRFPAGPIGTKNLQECGVGWAGTAGANLTTRALIVNPSGDPVTIQPQADELLDMTVQFRYYPPLTDVNGTVNLNGTDYDTVLRVANVTASPSPGFMGAELGIFPAAGVVGWRAYTGALGTVEQEPSGTPINCDYTSQANLTYQNNSYSRDMQCDCGTAGWIDAAGFRCLKIPTRAFDFQCSFASNPGGNTVPKDINHTMSFVWRLSWAAMNWAYAWTMEGAGAGAPAAGGWNMNPGATLLRINWVDADAADQREKLQVEPDTIFRIVESADATQWVEYKVVGAYVEDTNWTEYTVTENAIQNGGPGTGNLCAIKSTIFD